MVNHLAHKLFPDSKFTGVYADGITTQGLPTEYTEGIYTTHNFEHNMDFICNAVNCFPEYQSLVGDDWNDQTYGYALASQANRLISGSTALGLKCNSVYGNTSLYTVPASLSLCVTFRGTAEQYALIGDGRALVGMPNGTSNFTLYKRPDSGWLGGLCWSYTNAAATTESVATKLCFYNTVMSIITDGKPHCLVCCVNPTEKKIKAYVDGVYVNDGYNSYKTFTATPAAFIANNSFSMGSMGVATANTLTGGCTISNIKYFNFDISADGSAYTLDDYQNNRDVPDALSSAYIVSPDKVYPTVDSVTNTTPSVWMPGDYTGNPSISYTNSGLLQVTLGTGTIYTPVIKMILPKPLKANEPVTFNFMGDGTQTGSSTADVGLLMGIGHGTGYTSDALQVTESSLSGSGKLICNGTYTLTSNQTTDYIVLRLRHTADIPAITGAVYTFPKFSVSVAGKVLELQNKLSGTTWQDESGNGYDMALQGDFEIVKINTISIEDYLNSLKQDSNIGNILVNNNLSYDFEISQYKQQPLESLAIIFTAIALDNIAQES